VLVWEEDGEELPISISLQETIAPVDGIELLTLVLVSAIRVIPSLDMKVFVPLPSSLLMEQVTRGCVEEQKDIRRVIHVASMEIDSALKLKQLMVLMLIPYESIMIVHVNTSVRMLVDYMKTKNIPITIVHVLLVERYPLPILLEQTITVSQQELTLMIIPNTTSVTCYGMDLASLLVLVVMTLLNHGSIEN